MAKTSIEIFSNNPSPIFQKFQTSQLLVTHFKQPLSTHILSRGNFAYLGKTFLSLTSLYFLTKSINLLSPSSSSAIFNSLSFVGNDADFHRGPRRIIGESRRGDNNVANRFCAKFQANNGNEKIFSLSSLANS